MRRLLQWVRQAANWIGRGRREDEPVERSILWTEVESSCVQGVRYDGDTEELYVSFTDGSIYRYSRCPFITAVDMLSSVSKGQFMWRQVRGRFEYLRTQPRNR